jgi:hypothetical protein
VAIGKTRLAVKDALDGQEDIAAMRRGLYAISTELDEHAERMDEAHAEIIVQMQAHVDGLETKLDASVTRLEKIMGKGIALLLSTSVAVLLALGTALLNKVVG